MSITHFKMNILPRKSLVDKNGTLPEFLMEYKETYVIDNIDSFCSNYWKKHEINELYRQLSKYFNTESENSWDEELHILKNGSSKIDVWTDDVMVKFDSRHPDYTLLRNLIRVGENNDCVFVINETGKVVLPKFELVLEEFQISRAFKFINNPEAVLEEIRELKNKSGV